MADSNESQPIVRATKPVSEALLNEKVQITCWILHISFSDIILRQWQFPAGLPTSSAIPGVSHEQEVYIRAELGLIRTFHNNSGIAPSPPWSFAPPSVSVSVLFSQCFSLSGGLGPLGLVWASVLDVLGKRPTVRFWSQLLTCIESSTLTNMRRSFVPSWRLAR